MPGCPMTEYRGPSRWLGLATRVIVTSLWLVSTAVSADSTNAERILRQAWGGRAEHRDRADGIHRQDRLSNETCYAYALALIRQNRFSKARTILDEILERSPDHSEAREARLWMKVAHKQYHEAVPDLVRWVESLSVDAPGRLVNIATAGRLLGFIDVSLTTADADLLLLSGSEKIRAALKDADWGLFTRQRKHVQNRFVELIDLRDKTVAEVQAEFAKQKQGRLADLTADRESMRVRIQELNEQRNKMRDEIDRELAELQRADLPLRQQLSMLNATAGPIYRNLASIESNIYFIEHRLFHEEDPVARSWLLSDLRRLEWLAREYDRDLFTLDIQATGIQTDCARLHSDTNTQLASKQQNLDNARKEGGRVQQDIKRVDNIERKLRRDKGPAAKQGWQLTLRARTLGTYYNFALEMKRSEFLEQLAARAKAEK